MADTFCFAFDLMAWSDLHLPAHTHTHIEREKDTHTHLIPKHNHLSIERVVICFNVRRRRVKWYFYKRFDEFLPVLFSHSFYAIFRERKDKV